MYPTSAFGVALEHGTPAISFIRVASYGVEGCSVTAAANCRDAVPFYFGDDLIYEHSSFSVFGQYLGTDVGHKSYRLSRGRSTLRRANSVYVPQSRIRMIWEMIHSAVLVPYCVGFTYQESGPNKT